MKDPFVILRAELVSAAERAALPAPRKRWGWLRRPSRPVAVLLAALVIAGCAAAVASLTGSASQPLEGRVPGAITPASLAGYSYTITVTPSLAAGTAGWESLIIYTRTGAASNPPRRGTLVHPARAEGRLGIQRPRAPSSVAVPAPIAAPSASRAATPSRMSLPARRCSPSGLGARRSAPSLHPACRAAIEPPWSSSPPKDACSSSLPTDPSRSVSIRRG